MGKKVLFMRKGPRFFVAAVAVLVLASLAMPLGSAAWAQDSDDPRTLDCDDESGNDTATVPEAGGEQTYTCTLTDPDGDDSGTARDPVDDVLIDIENLDGANDPDDSSAAGTADFDDACETNNDGECDVTLEQDEAETGAADFCFWADTDDDAVFDPEGDADDGDGCNDETAATEDTDVLDVVALQWIDAESELLLDCDDESGNDSASNDTGTSEGYGCILTEPDGDDPGDVRDPVADIDIDGENLDGANDPDDDDGDGSADYDNVCQTDDDGECTFFLPLDEEEPGDAEVCFWPDTGEDSTFDPEGDAEDGGGCNDESAETEDDDAIDVVALTWISVEPRTIDCDPDSESLNIGEDHTIVCEVLTNDGDPSVGEGVTFTESGPGEITSDEEADTDSDGEVSVTVTSLDPGDQTVVATVTDDLEDEPDEDECDKDEDDPDGAPEGTCSDSVAVTWLEIPDACVGISNAIVGTEGDDEIEGTSGTDFICALGGDDVVDGLGGNDLILLGDGNDAALGGDGSDRVRGGSGNDFIRGGAETDLLVGGDGSDLIRGGADNDLVRGRGGADDLFGNSGSDRLNGGPGNDTLTGGPGTDSLKAGGGRDRCRDNADNIFRGCES